jgi:hypothetical protein
VDAEESDVTQIHRPQDFKVGDTWEIQGNLAYADGTPFDLGPGCNLQWAIQNSAGAITLELELGNGITILDPVNGICLITVTPTQSAAIPVGSYTDQLQATDPTGYVSTQWEGPINVYASFFD